MINIDIDISIDMAPPPTYLDRREGRVPPSPHTVCTGGSGRRRWGGAADFSSSFSSPDQPGWLRPPGVLSESQDCSGRDQSGCHSSVQLQLQNGWHPGSWISRTRVWADSLQSGPGSGRGDTVDQGGSESLPACLWPNSQLGCVLLTTSTQDTTNLKIIFSYNLGFMWWEGGTLLWRCVFSSVGPELLSMSAI